MKKLIRCIVLISFSSSILISCQNTMKQKEYFWDASVCTPKNYPAEIFSGHLILDINPESAYVYMPFDRVINSCYLGDNDGSSSGEAIGISPKILDITWLSYTENKSYSGIFKLNSEKIESLMIKGSERPYWDEETKKVEVLKDFDFTINTALFPGGMVVLYVFSPENTTIVGSYQANVNLKVDWSTAHEIMKDKAGMDRVIEVNTKDLPQEIKNQIKQGSIPFGYWKTLFKKYPITPIVKAEDKVETIKINYINGEFESIFLSLNKNVMPIKERAVPRKINIVWHDINDRRMESDIFFDEKKSKVIFENIKTGDEIKFVIEIDRNTKPREKKGISIKLKTSSTEIDMKEAVISQESFTKPNPY